MQTSATESFKRSLTYSLQEHFEPLCLMQLEDKLHRESFICSAPVWELGHLKIPKQIPQLLVDLPIKGKFGLRWGRFYFTLFFVQVRRMDGELRAVYEAQA